MTKRKAWVLDTGTKGTGAEMVPLEKVLKQPGAGPQPAVASKRRRRRASGAGAHAGPSLQAGRRHDT